MHKDKRANKPPSQTFGITIILRINCNILKTFAESETLREFIEDFRQSWFIVSQILVRTIKNKIKNRPCFTPHLLPIQLILFTYPRPFSKKKARGSS
jgi:hypothetical protein